MKLKDIRDEAQKLYEALPGDGKSVRRMTENEVSKLIQACINFLAALEQEKK